jgi:parallel beta-helix repeat protein
MGLNRWFVVSVVLLAAGGTAAGRIIYVDDDANVGGDGQTWGTAYKYLQDGLSAAGGGDEIWVAEGTYRPDCSSANPDGTSDAAATFRLKNGVAIYGGFPAGGGDWDDRLPAIYQTVLTGELGQENSSIVVNVDLTNRTAVLNGFVITGWRPYTGAGVRGQQGSPTISYCSVELEGSVASGWGIFCEGGRPVISSCRICNAGAGLNFRYSSRPTIRSCIIAGNDKYGIRCYQNCKLEVLNCTISDNGRGSGGSGIYAWLGCEVSIRNSIVWGNRGFAVVLISESSIDISYSDMEGGSPISFVPPEWDFNWGEGNIDADPLFDADYRLSAFSPCINAGDPNRTLGPDESDIDGEPRMVNARVDIGADELDRSGPVICLSAAKLDFVASVGGPVPEAQTVSVGNRGSGSMHWIVIEDCPWLEVSPESGQTSDEVDQLMITVDSSSLGPGAYTCELTLAAEEGINSPQKVAVTLYVRDEDGILNVPSEHATIQAAIDAAVDGDAVVVADGVYSGQGNTDIDFRGKHISVKSQNGPENCIVDCNGSAEAPHCGFYFHSNEDGNSMLEGFTITNGAASGEWPEDAGGGIRCLYASPTIVNCIVTGNTADGGGGGICSENCAGPRISHCIITNNVTAQGGGGICSYYSSPGVSNCVISENEAGYGGGAYCGRNSPTFENCVISDNTSMCNVSNVIHGGGAIYGYETRMTVINCGINDNRARLGQLAPRGGAIFFSGGGNSLTLIGSTVSNNVCEGEGGGIYAHHSASASVHNCVISNNVGWYGGGMYLNRGHFDIANCTIYENRATEKWGGVYVNSGDLTITNSIVWGNRYGQISGDFWISVIYSDVQGGWWGTGNLNTNPQFVDPAAGDFHLQPDSACVDAGGNASVPADIVDVDGDGNTAEPIPLDLDGNARMVDGDNDGNAVVDMGAYELVAPVEVALRFTPQTVNPESRGKWVRAHFVLPEGYVVEDVDANRPARITEPFEPDIESEYMNVFVNEDGLVEIEAAFDRGEFCAGGIDGNSIEVTAVGSFTTGRYFYGTETIKITTNYLKYVADLASYWLAADCGKPDWCGGVDLDQDSLVNFRDFALFDGCCVEVVAD